jgi:hypothetical protein
MIKALSMPPEPLLSYGRVKWDRDVWECMLPTMRHNSERDIDEVIAICVHRCMLDTFRRLDAAVEALNDVSAVIGTLDRRSTMIKADLFLSLDDVNRISETCSTIISTARTIRADPVNIAQASILLAVME